MKFSSSKTFLFFSLLFFIFFLIDSCAPFRESDKHIYKEFKKIQKTPQIYYENYNDKTIRYIADKPINNKLPTLLFIHGAPGSAENFFKYLQDDDLIKKANLITIDRLGYGYSNYGTTETSIEKQAESIYSIIKKHKLNNLVVVSWSFGVPIAAKMAYKYPEIKHSVMVAGAVSPDDEQFFGIAKLARWKLTKWMIPKVFKVADDEKMSHVAELTKMLNVWPAIKTPITYFHGTKDKIVPYKNMSFITANVNESLLTAITVKDANHFLMFKHYGMVKNELLTILEKL